MSWVLQQLFTMRELAPHLTFMGGTSLSKAWGLIDRFSEDIDLTIGRDALGFGGDNSPAQAPSAKQRSKRLKALKVACSEHVGNAVLPDLQERLAAIEDLAPWSLEIDDEDPDAQTILLRYPAHFDVRAARYLCPVVKIEFGARSDPWPMRVRIVRQILSLSRRLGPLLRSARKSAGLSQTALAQHLRISHSRVSAMELDPGSISVAQLLALFAALNHEMLVQPKQGAAVDSGGDSTVATPDW